MYCTCTYLQYNETRFFNIKVSFTLKFLLSPWFLSKKLGIVIIQNEVQQMQHFHGLGKLFIFWPAIVYSQEWRWTLAICTNSIREIKVTTPIRDPSNKATIPMRKNNKGRQTLVKHNHIKATLLLIWFLCLLKHNSYHGLVREGHSSFLTSCGYRYEA